MASPVVTILLPAYNAEQYIREAIQSILEQSFSDFELLVINDGSEDNTASILQSFRDKRIRILHHHRNYGLIHSLNEGLTEARGKYIARMDADDVSISMRIAKQVAVMQKYKNVDICFSYTQSHQRFQIYRHSPLSSDEIKIKLIFDNIIAHPTVMFRKRFLTEHELSYRPEYLHAEDYGLWMESIFLTDFYLIPVPLLYYREHKAQISKQHTQQQRNTVNKIHRHFFQKISLNPSHEELLLHLKIFSLEYDYQKDFLHKSEEWITRVKSHLLHTPFSKEAIANVCSWIWFELCTDFSSHGFNTQRIYYSSSLACPQIIKYPYLLKWKIKNFVARKSL